MSIGATRLCVLRVSTARAVLFVLVLFACGAAPKWLGAQAGQSQTGSAQPGDLRPTYPGEPFNNPPVETAVGPVKLRFYGTVLLNMSFSDSDEVGQDVPLWPLPSSTPIALSNGTTKPAGSIHDTIFTARQSILGVVLNPANVPASGWTPSAEVEIDFFGTTPIDADLPEDRVLNQPRLRKAFFRLRKGDFDLVAGQDNIIISPLDPVSLSHVAVPLGYAAGDLFGWLPQVRVDYNHSFGKTGTLFQFGLLRPSFGDPRLGDQPTSGLTIQQSSSGLGERAGQPFYPTRFAVSRPMQGSTATIGVGGHYGKEIVGATQDMDSWAVTLDFRVPLLSRLVFRGEAYTGRNLVPFGGGILQGVAAVPAPAPAPAGSLALIRRIGDTGGLAEFTILASRRNVFYLGASSDDPVHKDLLPGTTKDRNSVVWASYFRKLTSDITLAAEWSNWQFHTTTFVPVTNVPDGRGGGGRGNVVNIALAYQF
jgi:hypothetical protein